MNVFEAVKQSVTTRQAAEHYGVRVGRTGMCVCPFHDDKNPSKKVDRRFYPNLNKIQIFFKKHLFCNKSSSIKF